MGQFGALKYISFISYSDISYSKRLEKICFVNEQMIKYKIKSNGVLLKQVMNYLERF